MESAAQNNDPDFVPDPHPAHDPDFMPDEPKAPDTSDMKQYVQNNLNSFVKGSSEKPDPDFVKTQKSHMQTAHGFWDALLAGYQGSATGLSIRQNLPEKILDEHATMAEKVASQIGSLSDLPMMVGSGFLASETGPVGSMAAAFAVPATVRKILMDHYEKGDITDRQEFASRLMSTSWEAIKGATTGAVTALTGGIAGKYVGPLAKTAAEITAMTSVGSALEGRLPQPSDFASAAIVVGGLHAATSVIPKMRNMYSQTEEKPSEVAIRAQDDVGLKQDLIAGNLNQPKESIPIKINPETNEINIDPVTPEKIQQSQGSIEKEEFPRTEEESEILSKIGKNPEAPNKTLQDKWQDWYRKNVDKNAPLKWAIQESMDKGANINPEDNSYQASMRYASYQDSINSFFTDGTRDFDTGKKNGEGLSQIYSDVPNGDLDGFRAYGMAQRALELNERGINPWKDFDPENAKKVVEAGQDKYEELNQRRIDFKNRVLEYAKKSGLIDEGSQKRIVDANKQAFPFHRVQDQDVFTGKTSGSAVLKRIYGSDKQILDPILSDYRDTAMLIKKSMANNVRSMFVDNLRQGNMLDEGQEGINEADVYLRKVPNKLMPVEIGSDELSKALAKQGVDLKPEDITIFRPEKSYLKDNQIAVMADGKRVVYEGPPGVIESLKALDGDEAATGTWVGIMKAFADMERLGNTSSPTFGLSHFFRAATMTGVYTKTGQIPFYHAAAAIGEITGNSELYQDAKYHGAFAGMWQPIDEQFLAKSIESAGEETGFQNYAWNAIKHPLEASEAWIRLTDSASRLAEYKRALEQGRPPEEAAYMAREVVVDYGKVGLEKSALRAGTAFQGVHINSMDRLRLAFAEDPKSTIARLGAISAVSAMLWAVNKDDEAIQATPDWQKGLFWQINLSRASQSLGVSGVEHGDKSAIILRLPKPWSAGILFGTGVEVGLDVAYEKWKKEHPEEDKKQGLESNKTAMNFIRTLGASVLPPMVPNLASPIVEQGFNQQITSGRPLVSEDKQKLLPELRYENYTSETAKQIAKLIGYVPAVRDIGPSSDPLASPAVIENYIRGWTGTMGGLALKLSDKGLRAAGVGNQHTQPASSIAEWPFFDSFVSRYPSMKDQNLQNFYENRNAAQEVMNSVKYYSKKNMDPESAIRIVKTYPELMVSLDGIAKGISTAKQTLNNIQYNTDIPPVEKRQIMDKLMFQIGSMAKYGNYLTQTVKDSVQQKKAVNQ